MMANTTPEQMQAGMDAWMAWANQAGDAINDLGTPLGDGLTVETGSVTQTAGATPSGYSILEAGSLEAASKLLEEHPHLQTPGGASTQVLEFLPMPGM